MTVAASQDLIGWTEFLHGKISINIEAIQIQQVHCALSPCQIMGLDWMKLVSSQLMLISHSQWIFWNLTLYNKEHGYLQLKQCRDLLHEVDSLLDTSPDKIPEGSMYLLELDFSSLYNTSFEWQPYWVQAMKAAWRAGQRTVQPARRTSGSTQHAATQQQQSKLQYDFTRNDTQMRQDLGLQAAMR